MYAHITGILAPLFCCLVQENKLLNQITPIIILFKTASGSLPEELT